MVCNVYLFIFVPILLALTSPHCIFENLNAEETRLEKRLFQGALYNIVDTWLAYNMTAYIFIRCHVWFENEVADQVRLEAFQNLSQLL